MIQTNQRPITSQAGRLHGMKWCGVVLGSASLFGEQPKATNGELFDPNDMSRGSP